MDKNLDILTCAVSLIVKAAIMAGRFSGRARKRSLKRLAGTDADTKDKELLFLRDKVPARYAGLDPAKANQKAAEKATIHYSRATVYPLAHGDLPDSKAKDC